MPLRSMLFSSFRSEDKGIEGRNSWWGKGVSLRAGDASVGYSCISRALLLCWSRLGDARILLWRGGRAAPDVIAKERLGLSHGDL